MIYETIALVLLGLAAAWQAQLQPHDVPEERKVMDIREIEEARPVSPAYAAQPIPCGKDAPTFGAFCKQELYPFTRVQFNASTPGPGIPLGTQVPSL